MKTTRLFIFLILLGFALAVDASDSPFTEENVVPANLSSTTRIGEQATGTSAQAGENHPFPVTGVISANSSLRLRSWPWGVVLGSYPPDTRVKVTGSSGEFFTVEINGRKGYMHKNYISLPDKPASRVEPYYPGNTRQGGHIPLSQVAAVNSTWPPGNTSGYSTGYSTTPSAVEAALAGYKGGKLAPREFAALFGPVARQNMKRTGIPASVTLAQAALETGWGRSTIGDAKNIFGIKGTGPSGTIRVPTQEFVKGRMVSVHDNFRKYHSWQQSFEDHGKLLQKSRYSYALQYNKDPDRYAREIHKAGYATDPNYAKKLISIMKSNNFYQYDV